MSRIFLLLLIVFQSCENIKQRKITKSFCIDLKDENWEILESNKFSVLAPSAFRCTTYYEPTEGIYTGIIYCDDINISFDDSNYRWSNFPLTEEEYINSFFCKRPLMKDVTLAQLTNLITVKSNDSIKRIFPDCNYYAILKNTDKIYPIYIPQEVKSYRFIRHREDSLKTKIAYSDQKDSMRVWLEQIALKDSTRNGIVSVRMFCLCSNKQQRDMVIKMFKTVKFKP